ncbi:MAG TPA: PIG-L deacetylase family protein [Acidimicrobiales bacterium]|nr:PIG-L deacetylase family protein [Acidimicrobiales bacterium]
MSGPDDDLPAPASGLPVGDLLFDRPVSVDLPVPPSALAIGAHPDDIEFGCGATLARWARAGCRVHHLVLTDGSKGSWDPDEDLDALVAARADESRAAAAVIDGGRNPLPSDDRVLFLGRVDGELVNGPGERREVATLIRRLSPAVVLAHDPWRRYRLHPDHRHAGFLSLDALVAARDPHFFPEIGIAPHRPEALLLFEADLPNHVEDAAGFEAIKIEALMSHASQGVSTMGFETSPSGQPAADIEAFAAKVQDQLAAHGALASIRSGEAFHLIDDL